MATTSSGLIRRIATIATYPFTNLAALETSAIVLGQHIDTTTFTEADVMVRFHNGTMVPAGGSLTVGLVLDGYDSQDPTAFFIPSFSISDLPAGTVQVTSSTTFPFYSTVSLPSPLGRFLAVVLVGAQGTSGGDTLTAVLSVDLALKGGDPANTPWLPNALCGYDLM
jgi:hypothetical protein